MNKIVYCLPIIKTTRDEVLATIERGWAEYDYFEVWLDHIEDLTLEFVQNLQRQVGPHLIVLFRRQQLETPRMDWQLKTDILHALNGSETLVDFDIYSQAKELAYAQENQLKLTTILSYHNYTKTPSAEELNKVIENMAVYHPKTYKIATFCQSDHDMVRLIGLLNDLKESRREHIVLGMGEHGVLVRIYGLLAGNAMHFAPLTDAEKSAPGQLTKNQLEAILKALSQ